VGELVANEKLETENDGSSLKPQKCQRNCNNSMATKREIKKNSVHRLALLAKIAKKTIFGNDLRRAHERVRPAD
jgi:hypothetical protein